MKLVAYVIDGHNVDIRPAPAERDWMDASPQRFAYRCLPPNIANAHGWEILCPTAFSATWSGNPGYLEVQIQTGGNAEPPAISHFGLGILTFHLPCLFRTDPGYDLMVQGPVNRPKDGIAPLAGVIETDWAPYSFTMNWKFTRAATPVSFAQGEPFCHVFPVKRDELEAIEPELHLLSEAPDLKRQFDSWTKSRAQFNADLKRPDSEASAERWQKHYYYHGVDAAAQQTPIEGHRTRLRLRPFAK
ncbi:MAG: DUF6065 family protein [Xanthobacteraceae bacterium]